MSGCNTVSPGLLYKDTEAAIAYLVAAFGFRLRLQQTGAARRTHSELVVGNDGLVMLGQASDEFKGPKTLGIDPPSMIDVYVSDLHALRDRALAAGADVSDLELAPAGDRRFTATDPEGQVWVFAQRVR